MAGLSRRLAESAAPQFSHFHDLAEWSGLLHDYGKYTDCFQKMIRAGTGKCDSISEFIEKSSRVIAEIDI
jgi:hypothetical protein